jgi:hypothetical protein
MREVRDDSELPPRPVPAGYPPSPAASVGTGYGYGPLPRSQSQDYQYSPESDDSAHDRTWRVDGMQSALLLERDLNPVTDTTTSRGDVLAPVQLQNHSRR